MEPYVPRIGASSASRRQVRRAVVAVLLPLVVAVAGCAGSDEGSSGSSTTERQRTTTTAPELTTSELEGLLLAADDVPAGWSPAAGEDGAGADGEPEDGGSSELFCPAAAAPLRNEVHQGAETTLSRSEMGPEFFQGLLSAPDPLAHFEDMDNVFASCVGTQWTIDADGETMSMSMVQAEAPDLGDRASAYRVSGTGDQGTTVTMDVVMVLRGSVDQAYVGVSFAAPDVDVEQFAPGEFADMVAAGDEKVDEGLRNAA